MEYIIQPKKENAESRDALESQLIEQQATGNRQQATGIVIVIVIVIGTR